jgi:hypothetical protein
MTCQQPELDTASFEEAFRVFKEALGSSIRTGERNALSRGRGRRATLSWSSRTRKRT